RKRRVFDAFAGTLVVVELAQGFGHRHLPKLGQQAIKAHLAQVVALADDELSRRIIGLAQGVVGGVEQKGHYLGLPKLGRLAAQVQAQGIHPGNVAVHEATVRDQLDAVVSKIIVGRAHKIQHAPGPGARRVYDRTPQLPRLPEAGVGGVALEADVKGHRRAQRSYRLPRNIKPVNVERPIHEANQGIV
nr:hypothetical protein [Tanacetum cinerariifolium]